MMATKHVQQTQKTLTLCGQQLLTQQDIWYIRDRLHESCSFFRLWPSQLQQLMCKLARPMRWVQNEVLASQGSKPTGVCFILDGEAAVAVRSAPGSSLLKDVAVLKNGDTFGELSLLGAQRHPAFIVVRSKELLAVAIDAQQLAQAMLKQQWQAASGVSPGAADAQEQQDGEPCITVEALYKLIGKTGNEDKTALSQEQQAHVRRVQAQQLQSAVAAEEAIVGAWLAPPHTQQQQQQQPCLAAGAAGTNKGVLRQQRTTTYVCKHEEKRCSVQLQTGQSLGACPAMGTAPCNHMARHERQMPESAGGVGPGAMPAETGCAQTTAALVGHLARVRPGCSSSDDGGDDASKKSSMMLRSRHSSILHMAMMKAGSHVPEQL